MSGATGQEDKVYVGMMLCSAANTLSTGGSTVMRRAAVTRAICLLLSGCAWLPLDAAAQ
jgi:hypothetical protein